MAITATGASRQVQTARPPEVQWEGEDAGMADSDPDSDDGGGTGPPG